MQRNAYARREPSGHEQERSKERYVQAGFRRTLTYCDIDTSQLIEPSTMWWHDAKCLWNVRAGTCSGAKDVDGGCGRRPQDHNGKCEMARADGKGNTFDSIQGGNDGYYFSAF